MYQLKFQITVPREAAGSTRIRNALQVLVTGCSVQAAEVADDFMVAVQEAVINAMQHGQGTITAEGYCRCRDGKVGIKVRIIDQGPGVVVDGARPMPDVLAEHGRGIPLIQQYTDEAHFIRDKQGFICEMIKLFSQED